MSKVISVFCDGLCEPNPGGISTFGWVAYIGKEKLHEECSVVCSGDASTNNVAEYSGIISALGWLIANGFARNKIILQSDSQLCIRQLNGEYQVKSALIKPLYQQITTLSRNFRDLYFQWIPRTMNEEADMLSRRAFENHVKSRKFTRQGRAYELVDHVTQIGPSLYEVDSQSKFGVVYTVDLAIPSCDCPDFLMRGRKTGQCKHILAAQKAIEKVGAVV